MSPMFHPVAVVAQTILIWSRPQRVPMACRSWPDRGRIWFSNPHRVASAASSQGAASQSWAPPTTSMQPAGTATAILRRRRDALRRPVHAPDVIVVVNPNNPDGRVVSAADLGASGGRLCRNRRMACHRRSIRRFRRGVSLAHRNLPATIILRSFGKTYGLAGIRLGFAIAPKDLRTIRELSDCGRFPGLRWRSEPRRLPISPGSTASAGASPGPSPDLDGMLLSSGFDVVGGTLLFRLARHPDACIEFRVPCPGRHLGAEVSPRFQHSSLRHPAAGGLGRLGKRSGENLPHEEARINRAVPFKLAEHLETDPS